MHVDPGMSALLYRLGLCTTTLLGEVFEAPMLEMATILKAPRSLRIATQGDAIVMVNRSSWCLLPRYAATAVRTASR